MTPYISFITPVFNGEAHLRQCVESVIAAAGGYSVELIIVDDGSTDGSSEIGREFSKETSWIHYLRQENGGPSSARNAGLEVARGKYIGFVDCDDRVAPSYVSRLSHASVESPDIVVFGYEKISLDRHPRAYVPSARVHIGESDQLLANVSNDHELFWFACTKLFRADLLRNIQFDESLRLGEDTIFNLQSVARAKTIVRIPDPLYIYYDTPGSLSSPSYKAGLLENMERHFAARLRVHEQRGQSLTGLVRIDVCRYYLGHIVPWLVSNAMRMDSQEQLGELAKIRASRLVVTCFTWGVQVRGSRGFNVVLLLLRFRMLRLLRSLLSLRAKTHAAGAVVEAA